MSTDLPEFQASVEVSAELQTAADKDKQKWLTVAEGQRALELWKDTRRHIDEAAAKYEAADEDSDVEAILFLVLSSISLSSYLKTVSSAAERLIKLHLKTNGEK